MNAVALLLRDVTISHWNTGNKALLSQKSTVDAVTFTALKIATSVLCISGITQGILGKVEISKVKSLWDFC